MRGVGGILACDKRHADESPFVNDELCVSDGRNKTKPSLKGGARVNLICGALI